MNNNQESRINAIEKTLGTLIVWSARELGEMNVKELLDMLTPLPYQDEDDGFEEWFVNEQTQAEAAEAHLGDACRKIMLSCWKAARAKEKQA